MREYEFDFDEFNFILESLMAEKMEEADILLINKIRVLLNDYKYSVSILVKDKNIICNILANNEDKYSYSTVSLNQQLQNLINSKKESLLLVLDVYDRT